MAPWFRMGPGGGRGGAPSALWIELSCFSPRTNPSSSASVGWPFSRTILVTGCWDQAGSPRERASAAIVEMFMVLRKIGAGSVKGKGRLRRSDNVRVRVTAQDFQHGTVLFQFLQGFPERGFQGVSHGVYMEDVFPVDGFGRAGFNAYQVDAVPAGSSRSLPPGFPACAGCGSAGRCGPGRWAGCPGGR